MIQSQTEIKIDICEVSKFFDTPKGTVEAIHDVNLQIFTNEIVCL